jgi:2-isopropylmalate synthase
MVVGGETREVGAQGNGPLDAFCAALKNGVTGDFVLCNYDEHALDEGSESKAVAYIEIEYPDGTRFWGAGIDTDIIIASIKAVVSSLNRFAKKNAS